MQVRKALGVEGRYWTECDMKVHSNFVGDWMLDVRPPPASNNVSAAPVQASNANTGRPPECHTTLPAPSRRILH